MTSAIVILIILAVLDVMLFLACAELEKYKEVDDERSDSTPDE